MNKMSDMSTTVSYIFSGLMAVIGSWTANEIATIGGLLCALATVATNFVFRLLNYRLEKRKHEASLNKPYRKAAD